MADIKKKIINLLNKIVQLPVIYGTVTPMLRHCDMPYRVGFTETPFTNSCF